MYQELLEKLRPDEVVSIYHSDESSRFSTGFVLGWDDEKLLMGHISPTGYYDGYILTPLEGICCIRRGGAYEQKIQTLYLLRQQSHALWSVTDTDMTDFILHYTHQNGLVVSVHIGGSSFSGHVTDWSNTVLVLEDLTEYGVPDGTSTYFMEEIEQIDVDTDVEQTLKLLYDHRT